jgi:PilZ domain
LKGTQLPPIGGSCDSEAVNGEAKDISSDGLCIVTRRPIHVFYAILCKLRLPQAPASIPVLARVRWMV